MNLLKPFRGNLSRNKIRSGRLPTNPWIATDRESRILSSIVSKSERAKYIQIQDDETTESRRQNKSQLLQNDSVRRVDSLGSVSEHEDSVAFVPTFSDFVNSRSIVNKALELKDFAFDNNVDFMAITETWLKYDVDYANIIGELCPTGYKFPLQP